LLYADSFHVAKYLIKHEAYAQGYDVGFLPTDGDGGTNELHLDIGNLRCEHTPDSLLMQLPFYCPTFNSVRRLAENTKLQKALESAIAPNGVSLGFTSTDCNLYLALAHLLTPPQAKIEDVVKCPTNAREGLLHLVGLEQSELFADWIGEQPARQYYRHLLLKHELDALFKQPSSTETSRVY
jgi:hypothetical protein